VKLKKKVDTRGPPTNFFIDKVLWRGEEDLRFCFMLLEATYAALFLVGSLRLYAWQLNCWKILCSGRPEKTFWHGRCRFWETTSKQNSLESEQKWVNQVQGRPSRKSTAQTWTFLQGTKICFGMWWIKTSVCESPVCFTTCLFRKMHITSVTFQSHSYC
jgi:hypothetical protein